MVVEFYGNCCIFKKTSITFNNTLLYIHSCIYTNLSHRGYQLRRSTSMEEIGDYPKVAAWSFGAIWAPPLYYIFYSILAGNSRRVFLSCFSNVQGLLFVVVSRSSSSTHSSSFPHPCKQGAHTLEAFYSQNSQFFNYYTFFFQVIIWFCQSFFFSQLCFHLFLEPKYLST